MITLQVLQKGGASYPTAIAEAFEPSYISFMQQVTVGLDTTCTQFLYAGDMCIVSDSITSVRNAINSAAGVTACIAPSGVMRGNVRSLVVSFNLANVAYTANVNGFLGIYYTPTPESGAFKGLQYAQSVVDTDFASNVSALVTYGMILVKQITPSGQARDIYLNPTAIQNRFGSISTQYTYLLKDGNTQIKESRTSSTYTVRFNGISSGDTINTIVTDHGTITLNLPCVTAPNRTAIAAAITAWLTSKGAVTGTVAVTTPSSGVMQIVIPTSNIVFNSATCTINSVSTPENFEAS